MADYLDARPTEHEEMIRKWLTKPIVHRLADNPVRKPAHRFTYDGGYRLGRDNTLAVR